MATWNVAVNAYPIFASKNYVNEDTENYGTFTASEGQSLLDRVIDGDPYSYWIGTSQDDTINVVLTFSFNIGAAVAQRIIDLIILQNINWKRFYADYSVDGATNWTRITALDYSLTDNAATDIIANIAAGFTAGYIRITIQKTLVANDFKKCGGVIVCAGVVQLSGGFLNYKPDYRETVRALILGDGSQSRELIMRSGADYEFYGAAFDCPVATKAELDSLRSIKRGGDPFVFIPEPGDQQRDAYLCFFDGNWKHGYESPVRSVGYLIPMQVIEAGHH